MSIANTAQAKHWNTGPGVAHWVTNQARYDRMHEPFTALILEAATLRPGRNVLDVGCGCGGTTLAAARLVAPGQALGLDLSGPMLARARSDAEAAGLANVAFQRWQPLAANQWLLVPGAALAEHVRPPDPAPADGPGMFAFADPDRLRQILAAAGWRDVEITSEHASILVGGGGSVDDAVEFLRTATQGRTMLAGADPATADRALASVRAALTPHADADGVHLDAAVWLVQAVAH